MQGQVMSERGKERKERVARLSPCMKLKIDHCKLALPECHRPRSIVLGGLEPLIDILRKGLSRLIVLCKRVECGAIIAPVLLSCQERGR